MTDNEVIAKELKSAFFEGFHSFATPCSAYNTVEEAWEKSSTKMFYDSLLQEEE
jgi:hypothetical protein